MMAARDIMSILQMGRLIGSSSKHSSLAEERIIFLGQWHNGCEGQVEKLLDFDIDGVRIPFAGKYCFPVGLHLVPLRQYPSCKGFIGFYEVAAACRTLDTLVILDVCFLPPVSCASV